MMALQSHVNAIQLILSNVKTRCLLLYTMKNLQRANQSPASNL